MAYGWAGIKELLYIRGDKTVRYDQKQGLPDRSVDIHQDSTGTLWIASYGGGLTRLRDGHLKTITTKRRPAQQHAGWHARG